MTGENIQASIGEEVVRADEAGKAAELLFRNDLIRDAISKLYYRLLYHVRALLITKGLEPRSDEGALRLFSLHFVKSGPFEPLAAPTFSKLMKLREEAVYDPSYSFTADDYRNLAKEVESVVADIRRRLHAEGHAGE